MSVAQSLREVLSDPQTWLVWGVKQGWVSPPFCWTHDLPDLLDEEIEQVGEDESEMPCVPVVRLNARALHATEEEK